MPLTKLYSKVQKELRGEVPDTYQYTEAIPIMSSRFSERRYPRSVCFPINVNLLSPRRTAAIFPGRESPLHTKPDSPKLGVRRRDTCSHPHARNPPTMD